MDLTFDFVVVGAGTTGCVVAARLSERSEGSVCLLEAGPSDAGVEQILQLARWPELVGSSLDDPVDADVRGRTIRYRRGVVQGGSGSLNGCVAWRPPDIDMLAWEDAGAAGWGPAHVRDAVERAVDRCGLETMEPGSGLARAFIDAGVAAGFDRRALAADASRPGVGYWSFTKRGPLRRSSSVAYLHPVMGERSGPTVITDAAASRILIDPGGRAVGVETARGTILARREVIVSCGALGSPKLLMLSGIGPADALRSHGIDVVADLPVGRHLADHAIVGTLYEVDGDQGPRPLAGTEAVLLARFASEGPGPPDLMVFPYEGHHDEFRTRAEDPAPLPQCSFVAMVLRPITEGALSLSDADPAAPVLVEARLLDDPEDLDLRTAVEGLRLVRRLVDLQPLRGRIVRELAPGPDVPDEDLAAYASASVDSANHVAGTCRMGPADSPDAVVDPSLRVRGLRGLRVADASVFPRNVGVNPNLTCIAIGERCADLVAEASASP